MRSHLADFDLVIAQDIAQALRLMANGDWRPMAGGTDLMVLFNAGKLVHHKFVSIAKLSELRAITVSEDAVTLGAAVTYSVIQSNVVLQTEFPLLCQAANWTGSVANQNRGTLGGNIANASPAADTPPALLVYDADLELISERGSRRVSYDQFHTGYKKMELQPNELIANIHLPRPRRYLITYSRKVGTRKAQAISKVCFNAVAEVESSVIKQVRLGLGSVAPIPLRCRQTEALLTGERITSSLIAHARSLIATEIQPIDDLRSTAQYRASVTQNLLGEFLGRFL